MKENKNKKIKIAVLVSGGGTNLQALIDAQKSGIIKSGTIALVISGSPNAYALTRAQNAGIKTAVIVKKDYDSRDDYEGAMIAALKSEGIGLVILAGFMTILGERFISAFRDRIINVHPALIPSFCGEGYYGLKVHEAALSYGVKVTGATVHYVNEIPDGGRIILQKSVNIRKDDTPETLQRRVMEQAEWKILPRAAELVCREIRKGNGK